MATDTSKLAGTSEHAADNEEVVITTSEETPEEETTEETTEETEEPEPEADDMTEAEKVEAKNLYKLLKNPETSNLVLETLARKAGIISDTRPSTTTTEKVESMQEILRTALGQEFGFLADKLAPALEKIIGKSSQSSEARFQELEQQRIQNETNGAIERLTKETKGDSKKLENAMSALAEKYQPGPNVNPYDYIKGLYDMASSARRTQQVKSRTSDIINRNAANAADRLQPRGGSELPEKSGKKGIGAAIDRAWNELQKGKK